MGEINKFRVVVGLWDSVLTYKDGKLVGIKGRKIAGIETIEMEYIEMEYMDGSYEFVEMVDLLWFDDMEEFKNYMGGKK